MLVQLYFHSRPSCARERHQAAFENDADKELVVDGRLELARQDDELEMSQWANLVLQTNARIKQTEPRWQTTMWRSTRAECPRRDCGSGDSGCDDGSHYICARPGLCGHDRQSCMRRTA